ncbi:hypothetical protein JCM19037_1413 [Geomicrobium sp. JCM 19037]|uniref:hypothetical protein n=1 Tax=Geomicrobium sp. JCM 19037 TaxID=1460634 RepID=UPI00045F383A|nr:hypothetical protein [Geomicrobium sp. JCM 19037]GAK03120.1 hypothetical protein JCM19037_1413 [Geomicrobium sp. JCM 19037]
MTSKQQIKSLMSHRVTIDKRDRSYNGDWETVESYSDQPAFVEYGKRRSVNQQGVEVMVNALIFLPDDAPIDVQHESWRITQTHPYQRSPMEAINIAPIDDPRTGETHHYEIETRMGVR